MDYKLEVVVLPVTDVDRAKAFYQKLGGGLRRLCHRPRLSGWCR